ncbi:hypothetical protein PM082_015503 [Marasmius tenuissimus]|nr:hypothetical protein PM082_015503 [Marasmius tenuissimus]
MEEGLSAETLTVYSQTESVRIRETDGMLRDWKDSDLRRFSDVCQQWRAVVLDLPNWQDVVVYHDNVFPLQLPPGSLSLKAVVDLAESKGRGFRIILKAYGRGYRLRSPAIERSQAAQVGWRAFHYIGNDQVQVQFSCSVMDVVGRQIKGIEWLVISMSDYEIGTGSTMWDMMAKLKELPSLKGLTFTLGPIRDGNVWSWGTKSLRWASASSVQLGIQTLNILCTPATALWMLR